MFTENEVTTEFKATELSRLIEEALIYDDRILEVTDIDDEQVMTLFTENLKYIVMKELINITPKLIGLFNSIRILYSRIKGIQFYCFPK